MTDDAFALHDEIVQKAAEVIEERRPDASRELKSAFINAVAYCVTWVSGGHPDYLQGPSVREHAAGYLAHQRSSWTFFEAVEFMISDEGPIFGPLIGLHRRCWRDEFCFDDDPQDVEALNR